MLIAIEGIDGVGKTTIGKALAKRIGFKFVDKALQKAFDIPIDQYVKLRESLKTYPIANNELMAMFFGINNILCGAIGINDDIIADRYITSSYYWYGNQSNEHIYDALIHSAGKPALTVLLDASTKIILSRINNRKYEDENERKRELSIVQNQIFISKTTHFLERKMFDYIVVKNEKASVDEVVEIIVEQYEKRKSFNKENLSKTL